MKVKVVSTEKMVCEFDVSPDCSRNEVMGIVNNTLENGCAKTIELVKYGFEEIWLVSVISGHYCQCGAWTGVRCCSKNATKSVKTVLPKHRLQTELTHGGVLLIDASGPFNVDTECMRGLGLEDKQWFLDCGDIE